jgi:hypothetical protein
MEALMHDSDISAVTGLSTRAVVLLMLFLPATILLILIGLSYIHSPWT